MIESVNNDRIKEIAKLRMPKYQDKRGLFLVESKHLVDEAKSAGLLQEVFIKDGYDYEFENKTYISEKVINKLTSLDNAPKIIGVVKKLPKKEIDGKVLILDRIQNPGNMGTILRSALSFNVKNIIVSTDSVSIYNEKVIQSSAGAIFYLNIIEADITSEIEKLKNLGYIIYTTDVDGGASLKSISFKEKSAIIMGNEGSGVKDDIKALADEKLYIDINKEMESLNVAIATSIILYELDK